MSGQVEKIQSRQNPRIKDLVKLRDRKYRQKQKRFMIEGLYEISCALEGAVSLAELYYCPDYFKTNEYFAFVDKMQESGVTVVELDSSVFDKVCYRERPDGLIAVAPLEEKKLSDLSISEAKLVLVVEKVEKPGNLGNLLRTADAVGVDAVIVCDAVSDLYNPNVIRASRGLLFNMPVVVADNDEAMKCLKDAGLLVASTTPAARDDLWSADLTKPIAVVVGSESDGLSDFWLEQSDVQLKLPINGKADSLNVGMATAVVLYEVLRQRKA